LPLYEYQCEACGSRFERIQKYSDPPIAVCPSCGGSVRKLISSPAFQFKGTGWYVTDYARAGSGDSADKDSKDSRDSKDAPAGKTEGSETAEKAGKSGESQKSEKPAKPADKGKAPGSSTPTKSPDPKSS
jgi:putative FmdB family regulatory protein